MNTSTFETISQQIYEHPILLYMKGSPKQPRCGFSARAVQTLYACKASFSYIDVLENPDIRTILPKVSNWPTFPQLWIDTKFIGGCDIIIEMYQCGELQLIIQKTQDKFKNHVD